MKNSKLRRALLLLACAVMLVSLSVGATLAYLSSATDPVKNTFTVGQVNITLDEAHTNEYGDVIDDTRVAENAYHLMPGFDYVKDPTIHIADDSENCWVWAKIEVYANEGGDINALRERLAYDGPDGTLGLSKIVFGGVFEAETYTQGDNLYVWDSETIRLEQHVEADKNIFYIYYLQPHAAGEDLVLFDTLKIPHEWDNEEIINLNKIAMDITAYAIQADGFDNVDEAVDAFNKNKTGAHEGFDDLTRPTPVPAQNEG